MPIKINHALIMAAGRGARMMPLTAVIPKPMAPFQGTTLIADGIRQLRPHVDHVHITVGYLGPMLAEHVIGLGVSSVFNTNRLGNAAWLYQTLMRHVNEPVAVLTCDNVVDLDFTFLAAEYNAAGCPACMVVPVTPVPHLEGDYVFAEAGVVSALDRHRVSEAYCSGIQVVNPARINSLTGPLDNFYDVWRQLIALREVRASALYPRRWFAVDTLEQLNSLNGARTGTVSR
jgi:NDP-sugar pyrophosphorylase family protein